MVTVRTIEAHDELERQGESLVLHRGRVHHVSAIGTTIRDLARTQVTVTALAATLLEIFGEPPEGDVLALTRAAVDELISQGLLEMVEGTPA